MKIIASALIISIVLTAGTGCKKCYKCYMARQNGQYVTYGEVYTNGSAEAIYSETCTESAKENYESHQNDTIKDIGGNTILVHYSCVQE